MDGITFNKSICFQVATYENLRHSGKILIELINSILEQFLLPFDIPLEIYITKMNMREKTFLVDEKNLKKVYSMLENGEIQRFVMAEYYGEYDSLREEYINYQKKSGEGNFCAFGLSFICDYYDELERFLDTSKNPKIANTFCFEINEKMFNDTPDTKLQEKFINLFKTVFIKLNGVSGFITYESYASGGTFATPYEYERGLHEMFSFQNLDKLLRGYYWGNIITKNHIESLGGIEKIQTQAPCYKVDKIEFTDGQALYLQLTEDINDYSDDKLRLLRNYFQPVLPQNELILDYDPYNMKNEPYKKGMVRRLLEEDRCFATNDQSVYIEYLKKRDGR